MSRLINLIGAPSSGKSTAAYGVTFKLRMRGISSEFVDETAKEFTHEKRDLALACQPFVFGNQLMKIERVWNKYDYLITDCPLLLSHVYGKYLHDGNYPEAFYDTVIDVSRQYGGAYYFLLNDGEYDPVGRNQDEVEAEEVRKRILELLHDLDIPYKIILKDDHAADLIVRDIMNDL